MIILVSNEETISQHLHAVQLAGFAPAFNLLFYDSLNALSDVQVFLNNIVDSIL